MEDFEFQLSEYTFPIPAQLTAEQQPQTKPSEMERFWRVTGNWGEFGLYFGIGLSASLVVRSIPVFIPSAVILFPAVWVGLALMGTIAPTEDRTRYQVLLLVALTTVIGANWDAWIAWLAVNTWKVGLTLVLVGISIYFVELTVKGKKNV